MSSIFTLAIVGFWSWMFCDCARHEKEKTLWCLLIIACNILGAAVYFGVKWLPRSSPAFTHWLERDAKQTELKRAIADVRNIGKAYQFIRLGHLYQEMAQEGHALAAYQQALSREANNIEALWGCAVIELQNHHPELSVVWLQRLMTINPHFKYGDASLTYAHALYDLEKFEEAQQHLENHLREWSHPEAYLLMARIQSHKREFQEACRVLETMIQNVQNAPNFHYRQHQKQVAEGQRMLRRLNCSVGVNE